MIFYKENMEKFRKTLVFFLLFLYTIRAGYLRRGEQYMYYVTISGPDADDRIREIVAKATDDLREARSIARAITRSLPSVEDPLGRYTVCFILDEAGGFIDEI